MPMEKFPVYKEEKKVPVWHTAYHKGASHGSEQSNLLSCVFADNFQLLWVELLKLYSTFLLSLFWILVTSWQLCGGNIPVVSTQDYIIC
jgi:hypothetical protein